MKRSFMVLALLIAGLFIFAAEPAHAQSRSGVTVYGGPGGFSFEYYRWGNRGGGWYGRDGWYGGGWYDDYRYRRPMPPVYGPRYPRGGCYNGWDCGPRYDTRPPMRVVVQVYDPYYRVYQDYSVVAYWDQYNRRYFYYHPVTGVRCWY